jgi:acyl-CoA thioesterase
MTSNVFDEAVTLQPQADGTFIGNTHPAWWNMVGPFGGITAATVVQALVQHPHCLGEPAALTVNYVAALTGGPFHIALRITKTNRSSQHWMVEMQQTQSDGSSALVLTATAITAVRRKTYNGTDVEFPRVTAAHSLTRWDPNQITMEWMQRYDMRVLQGPVPDFDTPPPASGSSELPHSLTRQWVRHAEPRALDYTALAAMADVFYPRIWRQRHTWVPAGTVSMTVYFHADQADLAATGENFVLCEAHALTFRNGHSDQSARLWSDSGTLLATTHQLVYYKD